MDPKGKTWNRLRSSIGMPNFTAEEGVVTQDKGVIPQESGNGSSSGVPESSLQKA